MPNSPKIDWHPFSHIKWSELEEAHLAFLRTVQFLSAFQKGILNSKSSLIWIPGLQRIAGGWVEGSTTFRISLDIPRYQICIVDKKIQELDAVSLSELSEKDLMLWLEDKLAKYDLDLSNLSLPETDRGTKLPHVDHRLCLEFSKYFHNPYALLREVRNRFTNTGEVLINEMTLEQSLTHTLVDTGDPETNTLLTFGFDMEEENTPFWYIKTKPFLHTTELSPLKFGDWEEDQWTGAKMDWNSSHQETETFFFFTEAMGQLIKSLKDQ